MTKEVWYDVRHTYPSAVNLRKYAGTNLLVPCRTIKVEATLELPPRLVGKALRVRVVLEEAPYP